MQTTASSTFMFGFVGTSKVKVQGHGEIDLQYLEDRNMNISILMFGFMGIPAGYSFSR
jgi:hypothetical protein